MCEMDGGVLALALKSVREECVFLGGEERKQMREKS